MTATTNTPTLEERIVAIFKRVEEKETGHGAQSWFARLSDLAPNTVSRWHRGEIENPSGPGVRLLRLLEVTAEKVDDETLREIVDEVMETDEE